MEQNRPIYLDYMATTPIDDRVIEAMLPYLGVTGQFGNPSSKTHSYGQAAAIAVDNAREQVASVVGASTDAIVFTSGATESNNLAIIGAAQFYSRKGKHLVTMKTEHKAVLESFKHLEGQGFEVTYLDPLPDGLVDLQMLEQALRRDTILVSVMHVNNEIGTIQDIKAIGECLRGRGIIFHVDAAQSIGRLPVHLDALSIDLMSFSAHKAYGPKGVGALFIRQRPRIRLAPQSFGGGQEGGFRSGTLPTHQIVGMGCAFQIAEAMRELEEARLLKLRTQLLEGIQDLPSIRVNGTLTHRIAGNLNLCFEGIENAELIIKLNRLAFSTTSACSASRNKGSHVLEAIGLSAAEMQSSIRLSLGRFTTSDDILYIIEAIKTIFS